jgi:hypothetical protein
LGWRPDISQQLMVAHRAVRVRLKKKVSLGRHIVVQHDKKRTFRAPLSVGLNSALEMI